MSSKKGLRDEIVTWKSGFEAKVLKWDTGSTKVMFSCSVKYRWKICQARHHAKFDFGPVRYARMKLAVIQFCATVARSGFINNVVWNEIKYA